MVSRSRSLRTELAMRTTLGSRLRGRGMVVGRRSRAQASGGADAFLRAEPAKAMRSRQIALLRSSKYDQYTDYSLARQACSEAQAAADCGLSEEDAHETHIACRVRRTQPCDCADGGADAGAGSGALRGAGRRFDA